MSILSIFNEFINVQFTVVVSISSSVSCARGSCKPWLAAGRCFPLKYNTLKTLRYVTVKSHPYISDKAVYTALCEFCSSRILSSCVSFLSWHNYYERTCLMFSYTSSSLLAGILALHPGESKPNSIEGGFHNIILTRPPYSSSSFPRSLGNQLPFLKS